jgi:hypothetical protein
VAAYIQNQGAHTGNKHKVSSAVNSLGSSLKSSYCKQYVRADWAFRAPHSAGGPLPGLAGLS